MSSSCPEDCGPEEAGGAAGLQISSQLPQSLWRIHAWIRVLPWTGSTAAPSSSEGSPDVAAALQSKPTPFFTRPLVAQLHIWGFFLVSCPNLPVQDIEGSPREC